ncbi:uncharacterized protein [Ptychodera flava]|uniref:uncharacterized protein n=1 Tax=Ptychodera flava TaxID=63121 RepID=UPI00396A72FF
MKQSFVIDVLSLLLLCISLGAFSSKLTDQGISIRSTVKPQHAAQIMLTTLGLSIPTRPSDGETGQEKNMPNQSNGMLILSVGVTVMAIMTGIAIILVIIIWRKRREHTREETSPSAVSGEVEVRDGVGQGDLVYTSLRLDEIPPSNYEKLEKEGAI